MGIQPNIAPTSLFDIAPSNAGHSNAGTAKDDLFAKMMDRLLADAAERNREQQRAAMRAKAGQDSRPENGPALSGRAERAPHAPDRREPPRAEAQGGARDDQASRATAGDRRAESSKGGARETAAQEAKATDRPTAETEDITKTAQDTSAAEAPTDGTVTGDEAVPTEGERPTIADAMLPVTEATVEAATGAEPLILTLPNAMTPAVPVAEGAQQQGHAVAAAAAADAVPQATPAMGTLPGALSGQELTAMQPGEASVPVHALTEQAKAAQAASQTAAEQTAANQAGTGTLPTDGAELPLPDDLAELAAAKVAEKAEGKGAQTSADPDADNGTGGQQGADAALARPLQSAGTTTATAQTQPQAQAKPMEAGAAPAITPALQAGAAEPAAGPDHLAPGHADAKGTAPLDATAATVSLRPSRGSAATPQGVPQQVAVHIRKNVKDGNDQFTINLRPAELGGIDIKLDIGPDGRVSASVAVERVQTLELLQRDSRNLERALQEAGLQADSNSLSFSLRGEDNPFQNQGQRDGTGRHGRGFGNADEPSEPVAASHTVTLDPGRVDIRA